MDICFIGASGHSSYVLEGIRGDGRINITGIAPGSQGEEVNCFYSLLCNLGYSPTQYENYIRMLDELKPDIAIVDCYFGDHAKVAIEALKRGCHIFMDKPVATALEDLVKLRDTYEKSGKCLAAMFGMRYDQAFRTAWRVVRNGSIGEIRMINAQKSYKLGERAEFYRERDLYGGTIPWVGSHAVDWVYWFSGEKFLSVSALHSSRGNNGLGNLETTAICLFKLTNEVFASVNIDYLNPVQAPTHGDDRVRIAGTKGVIEVRSEAVFLINDEAEGIKKQELLPKEYIFADFLKQVRGEGSCKVSAEDSFYVTEACIRARMSADEYSIITF